MNMTMFLSTFFLILRLSYRSFTTDIAKNSLFPFEILNAEEKSIPKINYLTQNLKKFDKKIVDKLVSTLLIRDKNQISGSHYRNFLWHIVY